MKYVSTFLFFLSVSISFAADKTSPPTQVGMIRIFTSKNGPYFTKIDASNWGDGCEAEKMYTDVFLNEEQRRNALTILLSAKMSGAYIKVIHPDDGSDTCQAKGIILE